MKKVRNPLFYKGKIISDEAVEVPLFAIVDAFSCLDGSGVHEIIHRPDSFVKVEIDALFLHPVYVVVDRELARLDRLHYHCLLLDESVECAQRIPIGEIQVP